MAYCDSASRDPRKNNWARNQIKCHRKTSKQYVTSLDGKMNPRYSHVIMVSVCPILTVVRWPSRGSAIYSYVASKDNNLHWLTCRAKATDLVLCYRFPLLFLLTLGMSLPLLEFFSVPPLAGFFFQTSFLCRFFIWGEGIVTPTPVFFYWSAPKRINCCRHL